MAAGLGGLAIAAYLWLRPERFTAAIGVSSALLALGGLAHPNAAIQAIVLGVLILISDRHRLRWFHFVLAGAVGAALLSPWLWYLMQNAEVAKTQWATNTSRRTGGVSNPLMQLATDLWRRYWYHHTAYPKGIERLQVMPVVALLVCFALPLFNKHLRGGRNLLLIFAAVAFVALALLDGSRMIQYYVHVFPVYLAAAAVILTRLWQRGPVSQLATAVLVTALILPGFGFAVRVWQNPYTNQYLQAVNTIKTLQRPGDVVVGGSELGFALGFDAPFIDDQEKRVPNAAIFVDSDIYLTNMRGPWQDRLRNELARDYQRVYNTPRFRIYLRSDLVKERL
jgi:hypothetical protein